MIEILNGLHETVNYGGDTFSFRLFDNCEYEDYVDHWHTSVEVILPIKSGYTVLVGDERRELREGDIAVINSGIIHSLLAPPQGERFIMQFDAALLFNLNGMETLLFELKPLIILPKDSGALYTRMMGYFNNIIGEYNSDNDYKEAQIYAELVAAFVLLGRSGQYRLRADGAAVPHAKKQVHMEAMMKACAYINKHYTEKLTLDEVAAESGFSKYHFTRVFKEYMNMTYYDYLNTKRIKRAVELLNTPEMSITDVAMDSGFSSLSAFNRTFKAMKKCAPVSYRKNSDNPGTETGCPVSIRSVKK